MPASRRHDALFRWTSQIRVRAYQDGTVVDEADCLLDFLEAVGASFADDHVVWVYVVHGHASLIERLDQSCLADDECRSAWFLLGQKRCRCQCRRVEM